jgi:hypothetical protein
MKVTTIKVTPDLKTINSPEELKKIIRQRDEEIQHHAKRSKWLRIQRKALAWLVVLLLVGIGWIVAYKFAEGWWMKQLVVSASPHVRLVKTAKAAELVEVKGVESVKATPTYSIKQIVDAVHILESSGGKNDGCKKKGLVNGYGYAQHDSRKVWNCYKTHAEVRSLVEKWFAARVDSMGLPTALCYYNLGKVNEKLVDDCKYYQVFLEVVEG